MWFSGKVADYQSGEPGLESWHQRSLSSPPSCQWVPGQPLRTEAIETGVCSIEHQLCIQRTHDGITFTTRNYKPY